MLIRGIGVVGGFGVGIGALEAALEHPVVAPRSYCAKPDALESFVDKRRLRRLDHFSRMAALAGFLAFEDAGLAPPRSRCGPDNLGIVVATGYGASQTTFGFLDSFIEHGDRLASPTHFSHSVHNAAAANLALLLGATGANLTVSQFELSFGAALLTAAAWLEEGRVTSVLVGGVDEQCAVRDYCWEKFFGARLENCTPLDFTRQSAVQGEGAAFFLLARDGKARYGRVGEVQIGAGAPDFASMGSDAVLILGADGHRCCGPQYAAALAAVPLAAAYAPLYGSFPTAQAMDLAVAGLTLRRQTLFASPDPEAADGLLQKELIHLPLPAQDIVCLAFGNGDGWSRITLRDA